MSLADWELTKLAYYDNESEDLKKYRMVAYWIYKSHFPEPISIEEFLPLITDTKKVEIITESDPKMWIELAKRLNGK